MTYLSTTSGSRIVPEIAALMQPLSYDTMPAEALTVKDIMERTIISSGFFPILRVS